MKDPLKVHMTPTEAWVVLQDYIETDCGPSDEGWYSEELEEAIEVFHRLYSPHLTAKVLFPDSPIMWPRSEREGK